MVKNKNCTETQLLALKQLERYAKKSENKFSVEEIREPKNAGDLLTIKVSFSTEGFVQRDGGVQLNEHEIFYFCIPADFPHIKPIVHVDDAKFALLPHVQWNGELCLYYSSDREWNPQRGMYGLIERLIVWMKRASENKLNSIDFPLHPPVAWSMSTSEKILVEANAPVFADGHWYGYANLYPKPHDVLSLEKWDANVVRNNEYIIAPAVLLNRITNFQEYPKSFGDLTNMLKTDADVDIATLVRGLLISMIQGGNENKDVFFILGTFSRSGESHDDRKQHLVCWKFPQLLVKEIVKEYRKATRGGKKFDEVFEGVADEIATDTSRWDDAQIEWVKIVENRPEIIQARDATSPLKVLSDKKVLLLGCGAIGSKISYHLARSSIRSLHVVDNGFVKPGLLCRQNYKRGQIGQNKAEALKDNLDKIAEFDVHATPSNAVSEIISDPDFLDQFDIVIDATASNSVLSALDFAKNKGKAFACATMALSANAECSMLSFVSDSCVTSFSNLQKKTYLDLSSASDTRHFIETFWPQNMYKIGVEPEPGCSDATFIGADSEVSDLASLMLNMLAAQLNKQEPIKSFSYLHMRYDPEKDVDTLDVFLPYEDDHLLICPNTGYKIFISDEAQRKIHSIIKQEAQEHGDEKEAGGSLIGNQDLINKCIYVHDVLEAPTDSKPAATEFVFGVRDIENLDKQIKKKSNHHIKWLGHWHTHPNSKPIPSITDEKAMAQLLQNQPGPVLMIIIGLIENDYEYGGYVYESE